MNTQTATFMKALFGDKPEDQHILLWTLAGKRSRWFRDINEALGYAESNREQDVYIGAGLSPEDFGPTHRCPSERVSGIVGLWADLDLSSDAHPKAALPRTVEEALSILPAELPPTFVVETGNGAHAWWLFREPLIFDSDEERREAARLVYRWQSLLRLNASARGWAFDRLADLARVLRVPGTTNTKDPSRLKPVSIRSQTDQRYNPSDIEEYLDECAVPVPEVNEKTERSWTKPLTDPPLVIDPNVSVPEDLLRGLMELDMRFRNTWLRQRHDLKDQSQSGYDLALADFGIQAGMSEQQIVDLIIHHRRTHLQRPRSRLDYFQRTLAKASRRDGSVAPATHSPDAPAEDATPPHPEPAPDSATQKAILCERISKELGVRIVRIVKITGKDPTYQMQLETGKIEFPNVGKLIDQKSLRMAIASAVDRLIPKIKPHIWEQLAQALLDALTVEEGGEETDFVGSVRLYITQYLSETPFIDAIEGQPVQTLRKPTLIDGRIAICASDLQPYINRSFIQNYTVRAIASMLAAIGATSIRVRGTRFREQSRWVLPLSEFDPADYAPHLLEDGHDA